MKTVLQAGLLFTFIALVGPCSLADQTSAEALKEQILGRLQAIQSVECEYIYDYNTSYGTPFREKVTFKAKGAWVCYTRECFPEDVKTIAKKIDRIVGESNVHGTIDRLFVGDSVHFQTNGERFYFMAYNELSPLSIIGRSSAFSFWSYTDTLIDLMRAPGISFVEKGNGETLLYVFPEPPDGNYANDKTVHGAVLHLDEQLFIRQVDYVIRPPCSIEEMNSFARVKKPTGIYCLSASDYFEDPIDVNGIRFPTKARLVVWIRDLERTDMDELRGYLRLFEAGLTSTCEHLVHCDEVNVDKEKDSVRIEILPETIRINSPVLTESDFNIQPAQVDEYWDRATNDVWDKDGWCNLDQMRAQRKADTERYMAQRFRREGADKVMFVSVILGLVSASLLITAILAAKRRKAKK